DPQALWQQASMEFWDKADARYERSFSDKGEWKIQNKSMPEKWVMKYQNISFYCKLTPFKHTGVFPEQVAHWDFLNKLDLAGKKILNLFAYTGIPTLVLANKGAEVTHVDASYPTIGWARENAALSNLADKKIRWIQDDVIAFVRRELRRGSLYDGIIMDPPVLGHGPSGETWQFSKHFTELLADCVNLLSEKPLFVIANAYAVSASSLMLGNMVEDILSIKGGKTESGELCLTESTLRARVFSTGIFARWSI
ncbi:MAG: class I SAM-dependent methyltransferase, partial [Patescibacteria group bacterium]